MKTVHRLVAVGLVAGSLFTALVGGSGAVGAAEAERDIREFDGPALVQTKPVMAYANITLAPAQGTSNVVLIPAPSMIGPDDR